MSELASVPTATSGAYGIAYDFETGGLSPEKNPPLQLAMVVVTAALDEIDALSVKIKPVPGLIIEPGAAAVNGYTEAGWANAMPLKEAEVFFAKYIRQWFPDQKPVSIGHNIRRFDVTFLQKFFPMCAMMFSPDMVDTLVEFKEWRKKNNMLKVRDPATGALVNGKNNLGTLAKYAGYNIEKAHDAKYDCRASIAGLKWMLSGEGMRAAPADDGADRE